MTVLCKTLVVLVCFLLFISSKIHNSIVFGQTESPTPTLSSSNSSSYDNLQKQIKDYQEKITQLQGEQKTLSSQIKIMDSQIKVTELKIDAAKQKILDIQSDIEITKQKIVGFEQDLDETTRAMLGRITATYQVGQVETWQIFLTSGDISNFLTRLKYLKIVQAHDKKNAYAAEQAKVNYESQKSILEEKEAEQLSLEKKLQDYTKQLDDEKKNKESLLAVTKNSEKEYQKRLSDALRELQQIQKAAIVLTTTEPKDVKRGDVIGLMGNTGYSFGAHLHFGLYNISKLEDYSYYSNHENPASVLSGASVEWDTGCGGDPSGQSNTGSGSFSWPMGTSGLRITQGYGHTCYSNVYYRGNPHPAFDMYNNSDVTIRAVEDGKAYVCRNCTGDNGNGVFLFHDNGKMSLYWHLQ